MRGEGRGREAIGGTGIPFGYPIDARVCRAIGFGEFSSLIRATRLNDFALWLVAEI